MVANLHFLVKSENRIAIWALKSDNQQVRHSSHIAGLIIISTKNIEIINF